MENNKIAVGLDIGTTKIVAMIGRKNEYGKLEVLGIGKAKSLGVKTFFITIGQDSNFIENVKKEINIENQVLVMCAAGGRSIIAANLLQGEGYTAHNISDGFSGNGQDPGWKNEGLPTY